MPDDWVDVGSIPSWPFTFVEPPPAHYARVYYMPRVTGLPHVVVDDSPGASARFWQALIDSVRAPARGSRG